MVYRTSLAARRKSSRQIRRARKYRRIRPKLLVWRKPDADLSRRGNLRPTNLSSRFDVSDNFVSRRFLMDGGHRIAKAWLLGLSEIGAVQFEIDPEPDRVIAE